MAPILKESPFLILLLIFTASAVSSSSASTASSSASASTSRSSTAFLIMPNDAVVRMQASGPPSLPATGKVEDLVPPEIGGFGSFSAVNPIPLAIFAGSGNQAFSGQPSPASSLPPSPPASDPGILENMMDGASPLWLPPIATVFVYENDGVPDPDSFFSPDHVVPERLTFADLRLLETNSRLPTLHPGKFLTITNNSEVNFTVDDSRLSVPDAYVTRERVVHRVAQVSPANVSDSQSKSFWYPILQPLVKYALAVMAALAVLWGVYMWCPNSFKCLAFFGFLKLFGGSSTSTGGTGLQATARVVTEGLAGLISNVTGAITGRAAVTVSHDGGIVGSGPIETPVRDSSPGFLRRFLGGAAGLLGALVGIGRVAGQPRQNEVELQSLIRQPDPPENESLIRQPDPPENEQSEGEPTPEAADQPAPEAANQPAPEAANQAAPEAIQPLAAPRPLIPSRM